MADTLARKSPAYARLAVLSVGGLFALFMFAEMLLWVPIAQKMAGLSREVAEQTRDLGLNQGLYNGFLAAGLVFSCVGRITLDARRVLQIFLLICVIVAGIVGAWSLKYPMLLVYQSLPGVAALAAVLGMFGVAAR